MDTESLTDSEQDDENTMVFRRENSENSDTFSYLTQEIVESDEENSDFEEHPFYLIEMEILLLRTTAPAA